MNVYGAVIQIAIVESVIVQIMIIHVIVATPVKVHPKDEVSQTQRNKLHCYARRRIQRGTILQRESFDVGEVSFLNIDTCIFFIRKSFS